MPINKLQGKRWINWWQHWVVNIQLENTYSTGFEHQNLMITFWFTKCKMMNRTVGGYKLFSRTHRIFKTIDHSQSKQSGNWSVQSVPMSKVLLGHSRHHLLACCGGCLQPSSSGTFTSFEITVLGPKVCCWSQMVATESQRSSCQHCLRAGITIVSSYASLFLQCGFLGSNSGLSNKLNNPSSLGVVIVIACSSWTCSPSQRGSQ